MSKNIPPIVPMSHPDLSESERQAVAAVMNTPNLSMGAQIGQFEEAFTRYTGLKEAVGVNSGTAGLHLCVRAADIGPGDLVITTPFSFVASTNVLLFERATPIFVDVDPATGNMDVQQVADAARDLTAGGVAAKRWLPPTGAPQDGRLRGILGVDVFGQPADWDSLRETADRHNLALIEDACEALGAEYKGRKVGTMGDSAVFAFYPNKQITVGEGGMIVTDDTKAANMMRALRNQGRAPGDTWLQHTYLGYNYRLDEMSAALGVAQMQRLEELIVKRERVAQRYNSLLRGIAGIELPQLSPHTTRVSWFVYVIRTAPGLNRDALAERLSELGIPVRPYFLPIHLQPYIAQAYGYRPGSFPVTEDLGERGLALPFSGVMTDEQIELVVDGIRKAVG